MTTKLLLAAALVLGLSGTAHAQAALSDQYTECLAAAKTDLAAQKVCVQDEWSTQDAYLGDIYAETLGYIPEDSVVFVRYAQSAWTKFRDTNCAYYATLNEEAAILGEDTCKLRLTLDRSDEILLGVDFAVPPK